MATPNTLIASNYSSPDVLDIDDDPDSPDVNWLAWDGSGNTSCRVTFPTPSGNPSGSQEFRVLIRNDSAGTNNTSWSLELWENGSQVSVLAAGSDPAESGVVVSGSWDASSLGTADGSLVECLLVQTGGATGNPSKRKGIEVGAVEWNVAVAVSDTAIIVPVGGLAFISVAPTVVTTAHMTIEVPVGSIATASDVPNVVIAQYITSDVVALIISGIPPTIEVSDHQARAPPTVQISLAAASPSVQITHNRQTNTASLTLQGETPIVVTSQGIEIVVPTGNVSLTTSAPIVPIGDSIIVTPGTGALSTTTVTHMAFRVYNSIVRPGMLPSEAALLVENLMGEP